LRAEVELLKRQVASLESLVQLTCRHVIPAERRNPRLAITVPNPDTSVYPSPGDQANTYWIRFVDASFTKTQGNQTPTTRDRQTAGEEFAIAHNLQEGHVPEETPVLVTNELTESGTRQWWFNFGWSSYVVYGFVKGAIAAGATTFTMDNVVAMQGSSPLDDPTDATETLACQYITGLPALDNAAAIAWYDRTNGVWRGMAFVDTTTC